MLFHLSKYPTNQLKYGNPLSNLIVKNNNYSLIKIKI